MRLDVVYRGSLCLAYAFYDNSGRSPAMDFLERLRRTNGNSYGALVRRAENHVNYGPVANSAISRPIKGRGNLYEFKSHQGDRLLYFLLPGGDIVLIGGFHKGAPPEPEFDRAERLRGIILTWFRRRG